MSRLIAGLVVVAVLAGCMPAVRLAVTAPAQHAPIPDGLGRARVSIQWPEQRRQVQSIPSEAAVANLEVRDASQSVIASASVARTIGLTASTVDLDLPVGADRYLTVALDGADVKRIAVGRSRAFEVRRNQTVTVPVTVEPVIKTFFGPLTAFSASGGNTSSPGFARLWSVAVGPDDAVYYPDFSDHALRAVRQDGTMRVVLGQVTDTSTQSQGIASTVSPDNSGDGGPASEATCRTPHGVYVAPNGDVYFADTLALSTSTSPAIVRLRLIPATSGLRFGEQRQAGYVYTLRTLGSAFAAIGMVQDTDGSLLYTEQAANTIWRLSPEGSPSVFMGNASGSIEDGLTPPEVSLFGPWGLTCDERGNLFYSEYLGSRVRMLCRVAGTYFGIAMQAGRVYTVLDGGSLKNRLALSTLPAPRQVAVGFGNCYVVDNGNNAVYRLDPAGQVTRVAGGTRNAFNTLAVGDEGPAASASFLLPHGLALDSHNRLYVGDSYNGRIRWIHL